MTTFRRCETSIRDDKAADFINNYLGRRIALYPKKKRPEHGLALVRWPRGVTLKYIGEVCSGMRAPHCLQPTGRVRSYGGPV